MCCCCTAGLDRKLSTGNVAPYWSDHSSEVIFLSSTLMPNSDKYPDHSHKKQQIQNLYVVIVWTEPGTDYQPATFWKNSKKNSVQIVITPLECGLYSVRVHSSKPDKPVCVLVVDPSWRIVWLTTCALSL